MTERRQFHCSVCGDSTHTKRKHFEATGQRVPVERQQAILLPERPALGSERPVLAQRGARSEFTGPDGFQRFHARIWEELRFRPPSPMQLEIADWIVNGPDESVTLAPRGAAKSTTTIAVVLWTLYQDPNEKVVVISKSSAFARKWSDTVLRLIRNVEWLRHLHPDNEQRQSGVSFDVAGATPSLHSSVVSFGIEAQVTGARASFVVLDDVETPINTRTQEGRFQLEEDSREVRNLAISNRRFRVKWLGTIHGGEDSIYLKLAERGYRTRKWVIAYPTRELAPAIVKDLAPSILANMQRNPSLMEGGFEGRVGQPVDPERFNAAEVEARIKNGWANFLMQSMLTPLVGEHRCPLKLRDLCVVDSLSTEEGPLRITWENKLEQAIRDLFFPGFERDCWMSVKASEETKPYQGAVMALDPASTEGDDDFAYAIVACLNSQLYLLDVGTLAGLDEERLRDLAALCVRKRVTVIYDELNYAGGMFRQLFQPILLDVCSKSDPPWRCAFDEKGYRRWGETTKEKTISALLGNVMAQHRLVVPREVIQRDLDYRRPHLSPAKCRSYQLFHQMSRLVPDVPGSLEHDDRIDALAMAVHYWKGSMALDREETIRRERMKNLREDGPTIFRNGHTIDGVGPEVGRRRRGWGSWILDKEGVRIGAGTR